MTAGVSRPLRDMAMKGSALEMNRRGEACAGDTAGGGESSRTGGRMNEHGYEALWTTGCKAARPFNNNSTSAKVPLP